MRLVSAVISLAIAFGGIPAAAGVASAADASPTRLALAMPLTVPPESTGLISAEDLETYTSPMGTLTRKLNAVEGQQVAVGIDPMIIASIRILGNTAPQSAIDWLERLHGIGNETFALSYADSDLAALSQAGSGAVLAPTSFIIDPSRYPVEPEEPGETSPPGQTQAPVAPDVPTLETITQWTHTLENVLWPRRNTVTAADLASFNATAPVTTILGSGNVTATPSASAVVGENAVLVSDEIVSSLLTQAVNAEGVSRAQVAGEGVRVAAALLPHQARGLEQPDPGPRQVCLDPQRDLVTQLDIDRERGVDLGERIGRELDVDDGTDHADDPAGSACFRTRGVRGRTRLLHGELERARLRRCRSLPFQRLAQCNGRQLLRHP